VPRLSRLIAGSLLRIYLDLVCRELQADSATDHAIDFNRVKSVAAMQE
jgi:hypothetical protein